MQVSLSLTSPGDTSCGLSGRWVQGAGRDMLWWPQAPRPSLSGAQRAFLDGSGGGRCAWWVMRDGRQDVGPVPSGRLGSAPSAVVRLTPHIEGGTGQGPSEVLQDPVEPTSHCQSG